MAKRRRELDSDGTATETEEFERLFVDTSLDTHLLMAVSSSDTVSDFKKKIALEHKQCFPAAGEILIHSLKVKCGSNFYHLPDMLPVWSAFHRAKRNWFLSADVSVARTCHSIKTSCDFDTNNGVKMGVTILDDNCRGLSSDVNRIQTLSIPLPDGATEKNVVSEMIAGFEFEKSVEKTTDFQSNMCSEENCMGTDSRPKKKRKVRNTEDAWHRSADDCNFFQASCRDTSIAEVFGSGNVMVDAVRESPGGEILLEQNEEGIDHFDAENRVVLKGTCPPTATEKSNLGNIITSQNRLASDERKEENVSESRLDHELAQDALTNHLEGVSDKVPDHSARLMVAACGVGELNSRSRRRRRKRKQVQKTARNAQDTTDQEQTGKGESIEALAPTDERKEENVSESNMDHELAQDVPTNHAEGVSDIVPDHSARLMDAGCGVGEFNTDGSKRKKNKVQKTARNAQDTTDQEQTGKGESIKALSPSDERKEENVLETKMDHELAQDAPTNHLEGVSNKVPDHSARFMDAGCGVGEVNADGSKRKKKKVQKTARNAQDTTEQEQTGKGDSIEALSPTDERKEENVSESNMDHELAQDAPTNHAEGVSDIVPDHSAKLMDAGSGVGEFNTDGSKRKKKKVQKTARNAQDTTDQEQTGKVESIKALAPTDERKEENVSETKMDHELAQDAPTNHLEGVSDKVPDHSARLMDAGCGVGEINADGSKRMKKKVQKTARNAQDTTDQEQTKGESIKALAPTDERKEEKVSESKMDHELACDAPANHPEGVSDKVLDHSARFMDAGCGVGEVNIDGSERKKKKVQKKARNAQDATDKEQTGKGESIKALAPTDERKEVNVSENKMDHELAQDAPTNHPDGVSDNVPDQSARLMDAGCGVGEVNTDGSKRTKIKVQKTARNAQDTTDKEQTGKGESIRALETTEISISFVDSEQENRHLGSSQSQVLLSRTEDKSNNTHGIAENTCDLAKTSEKEGEGISFRQYFVPGQYQDKVDSGVKVKKATKSNQDMETSKTLKHNVIPSVSNSTELQSSIKSFENKKGENKSRRKGSSRSIGESAQKSNCDEMISNSFRRSSRLSENGVKCSRPSEICETTLQKPNEILVASSRLNKKNCGSLEKPSSENSIKSFENKKSENKSHKNGSSRSIGESVQNSDRYEIISNTLKRSSGASENGAEHSRPSEMCETTPQKPDEILAATSRLNKKNHESLEKSSSKRSEIFPGKQGNKMLQSGMNATSLMLMNTPQRRSLLTKSGAIFQDTSGESYGDDNGTMHSDGSTLSPSDSSSMSGHSVEESDLSHYSTRNGPSDAKGRSMGRRNMSKLDLSASTDDITMDLILRSSKRFKKAKLVASQYGDEQAESQPIEFVPDSLPS